MLPHGKNLIKNKDQTPEKQLCLGSNPRRFMAVPLLRHNRRAEYVFKATVTIMTLQGTESNEGLMGVNMLTRGSNTI